MFPLGERTHGGAGRAVFGDIDLDQLEDLAAVLGLTSPQVEDGFDRLVRADLLRPSPERYEFVHDLVRETLYDDLGPGRATPSARCCGAGLARSAAPAGGVDLVELAHHLS